MTDRPSLTHAHTLALALARELDRDPVMVELDVLRARVVELEKLISSPETEDFTRGVAIEVAHQADRWGPRHDVDKSPGDWFWLIGYLAQKAMVAQLAGDAEKAKHHCITSAAALSIWHRLIA